MCSASCILNSLKNGLKKTFSNACKKKIYHVFPIRSGVLDVQPVLDGHILDRGIPRQRVEDGQEVRHRPHLMVLRLHHLRLTLRTQRLRGFQPARVRQRLLSRQIHTIVVFIATEFSIETS